MKNFHLVGAPLASSRSLGQAEIMELAVNITRFSGPRPLAVVIGHERSGNHFLMNAIAASCGYTVSPYLDLDHADININFHHPDMLENVLTALTRESVAKVLKSHHHAAFFAPILAEIAGRVPLIYIYRHPLPVMESFWKFVQGWPWPEGPAASDVVSFTQAAPSGRMLRYQMSQAESLFARWSGHVSGWLDAAAAYPDVHVVRYEDLRDRYDQTMAGVCAVLGCAGNPPVTPARENYVKAPGAAELAVSDADQAHLREWINGQMPANLAPLFPE